ncbi:hypothetical protein [Stigmatella aurantiaca]|uniref:Conserved uncharacterized protein n=1 Tax=Stigmatella aurantiaca (strain DW4/3-1) TaxID=378806 RepID=E3FV23_STIAD|nr:hypothetical protein [Stigmatella aurantiaca]ADO68461.1 conserved uncharacterized protein [Stigmatella aurantiaca DW4/3-1]
MAVRTTLAGMKNRRTVDVRSAQPSQQASKGKKTLPRDEAALLRREKALQRVTLGPASEIHEPKSHRRRTSVQGRKKAPSQMGVKGSGGPARRSLLHGG